MHDCTGLDADSALSIAMNQTQADDVNHTDSTGLTVLRYVTEPFNFWNFWSTVKNSIIRMELDPSSGPVQQARKSVMKLFNNGLVMTKFDGG